VKDAGEIMYSARQRIPFPGKTGAAVRVEKKGVQVEEEELASLRREITRDVKVAYFDLYRIDRQIEINAKNREVMDRFVELARRQYEVGMGRQPDILRSQTELAALKAEAVALSEGREAVESSLNVLLNRPMGWEYPRIPERDTASAADWWGWDLDRLGTLAKRANPELKAMEALLDMRRAQVEAARKEFYPDFMVGGAYKDMRDMPDDAWSVMVGVEVPIAPWSLPKYKGELAERRASLQEAIQKHHNHVKMVVSRVRQVLARARSRREIVLLARHTLIPQAEQAMRSAFGAYQTGKADFTSLLDAYRAVLAAQVEYHNAVSSWLASGAELEQAVGLELEDIQTELEKTNPSEGEEK
jgi:outer membrane protein TolC